jgi:hypothetical protein
MAHTRRRPPALARYDRSAALVNWLIPHTCRRSHDAGLAPIRMNINNRYAIVLSDDAKDFGDGVWLRLRLLLWLRLSNNYFAVDGNLLLSICIKLGTGEGSALTDNSC